MALHFLCITHLGQSEGIRVERFEVDIVVRGIAGDVVDGGFLVFHLYRGLGAVAESRCKMVGKTFGCKCWGGECVS